MADNQSCAHAATADFHRLLARELPEHDEQDWEDAQRGFVGTIPNAKVAARQRPRRVEPGGLRLSETPPRRRIPSTRACGGRRG
ncbi:hypothetical protein ACU4HD_10895 [Cupriavidus basilensis]